MRGVSSGQTTTTRPRHARQKTRRASQRWRAASSQSGAGSSAATWNPPLSPPRGRFTAPQGAGGEPTSEEGRTTSTCCQAIFFSHVASSPVTRTRAAVQLIAHPAGRLICHILEDLRVDNVGAVQEIACMGLPSCRLFPWVFLSPLPPLGKGGSACCKLLLSIALCFGYPLP